MGGLRMFLLVSVVVGCGAGSLIAPKLTRVPGLWTVLAIGAAARIAVAVLAQPITPADVGTVFANIGHEVVARRDPALSLSGHDWNFLPLMPYLWAALLKTGAAWTTTMKVIPVASDIVNIWLVGLLAHQASRTGWVRLAYALSPIALIVVGVHGQVEPTSIMFLLAGLVLFQRDRDLSAGLLFGLAIATKTWPVLVVVPVLLPFGRRALKPAAAAVGVMAALAASSVVALGSPPIDLAHKLSSYSSFAGFWGWAGAWVSFGHTDAVGYDSSVSRFGSTLVLLAIAATLVLYRRDALLRRAWATPIATLVVTAGFGPQYLMWPVSFLTADEEPSAFFVVAASAYALLSYLPVFPGDNGRLQFLAGLSWVVIASMVHLLVTARRSTGTTPARPAVPDLLTSLAPTT